jgi:hypothetical protein
VDFPKQLTDTHSKIDITDFVKLGGDIRKLLGVQK